VPVLEEALEWHVHLMRLKRIATDRLSKQSGEGDPLTYEEYQNSHEFEPQVAPLRLEFQSDLGLESVRDGEVRLSTGWSCDLQAILDARREFQILMKNPNLRTAKQMNEKKAKLKQELGRKNELQKKNEKLILREVEVELEIQNRKHAILESEDVD